MWRVALKNLKAILIFSTIGVFILLSVATVRTSSTALAQEKSQNINMRELLESLKTRLLAEPDLVIGIKFAHPILEDNDVFWEIPDSTNGGDFWRQFGEIGNDFVCFDERAGSSFGTRCTSFSNIVAVSFFENP